MFARWLRARGAALAFQRLARSRALRGRSPPPMAASPCSRRERSCIVHRLQEVNLLVEMIDLFVEQSSRTMEQFCLSSCSNQKINSARSVRSSVGPVGNGSRIVSGPSESAWSDAAGRSSIRSVLHQAVRCSAEVLARGFVLCTGRRAIVAINDACQRHLPETTLDRTWSSVQIDLRVPARIRPLNLLLRYRT